MIPIFPLKLVVFPEEKLNLHIFEPRYRELVNDVMNNQTNFGIVSYMDDNKIEFGTEIELLSIEKTYPDGKMDIKTKGLRIFKVIDFYGKYPNKLYPGAEIIFLENDNSSNPILKKKVLDLVSELYKVMKITREVPESIDHFNSFDLAHHVGFNLEQEYEFLQISSELKRLEKIRNHLEFLIPKLYDMEALRKKIEMNGHFKNIIPPQV